MSTAKWHGECQLLFVYFEKWTWTFLLVNSSRRPPFPYIHILRRGGARMRRTPRYPYAKHLHESPNYQVHTCCQYIGEVILAQLDHEDNRQTLRERRSNLWHPTVFLLEQAVHDVRRSRRYFFTIATSPSMSLRMVDLTVIRGAAAELCAQETPRRRTKSCCHRNSTLCIQIIYYYKPWTSGHGLTSLSESNGRQRNSNMARNSQGETGKVEMHARP